MATAIVNKSAENISVDTKQSGAVIMIYRTIIHTSFDNVDDIQRIVFTDTCNNINTNYRGLKNSHYVVLISSADR